MDETDKSKTESELERLQAENKKLKDLLRQYGIFVPDEDHQMTRDEKLAVYQDYFHGRTDIYSKYYYSKSGKKHSWAIACANFWHENCLIRKRVTINNRCFNCPVSAFKPLTEETLTHLFTGDNQDDFYGVGIYPLLDDNTCYFLAMDFDDDKWFDELQSVYHTAVSSDFYPVMERSQSGNGGHLWFFFATNVKAYDARRFGEIILEKSMNDNKNISFRSFDRMIPNQDYAPKKGKGNFIALPLRADTYRLGNSAFINAKGQKIRQPFEFLRSRPKITEEELQAFISENTNRDYFFDDDQMQMNLHTDAGYSPVLTGFIYGRIFIDKKGLNAATVNVIHRCASMWDPEYYEKLRRHESIYSKSTPRVLHFDQENDRFISLPSGTLDKLKSCLPETEFKLEERYSEGTDINVSFTGTLHKNQQDAVDNLIQHNNGVLNAVPSFGKTVCAIWMIAYFHVSTLIIVNTNDLQIQWENRINQFLAYPTPEKKRDKFIRIFNGDKKTLGCNIDIATADSLVNLKDLRKKLSVYGLVIVDECHHVPTSTYQTVLSNCSARHIYGLTATPSRRDGLEKVIYMYLGPVRYRYTQNQAQTSYHFRRVLVPRYTASRMLDENYKYQDMMTSLMKDQARNWLIYRDVVKEYENGGKIIILSERVEHLRILADLLEKRCDDVYLLTGSVKKKERQETIDHVRMLHADQKYILLATSSLLGEGFDLPSLKTMFLVLPISAESRVEQYTGRIHRNYEGKDVVKVYDYVDLEISIAASMYHKRLIQYQKEGYFVEESEKEVQVNQFFFEGNTGKQVVEKKIANASEEILCFSSEPSLQFIQDHYQTLQEPLHRGVKVYIVLPVSFSDTEESKYLTGMGAHLIYSDHNRHFLVIDHNDVWISDKEFLSDDTNGYFTREVNPELAGELHNSIRVRNETSEEDIFKEQESYD